MFEKTYINTFLGSNVLFCLIEKHKVYTEFLLAFLANFTFYLARKILEAWET